MEGEEDRFGEIMRLVELAKEDIYFAAKDRELTAWIHQEGRWVPVNSLVPKDAVGRV